MTQNPTIPEKRPRLVTVDIMQGVAMLLVVIGHHLLDFMPVGYGQFHHWLYIFHMPYFIFISGFLIAYSYKGEQYGKYVSRRFRKFFIPYVIIGVIVTLLAGLKYGIASIGNNLLNLFISPKQSEATFLWYIYLLFFLYALYPAIHFIQKKNPVLCNAVLVIIGIILFMFPVRTQLLCLDYFTEYFIFYALGIVVSSFFKQIMSHPQANIAAGSVSLVCFIIISILTFRGGRTKLVFLAAVFSGYSCNVRLVVYNKTHPSCQEHPGLHLKELLSDIPAAHVLCTRDSFYIYTHQQQ